MAIYRWAIKTGDQRLSGTDANVLMSLRGTKGAMAELELRDPNDTDNWQQGEVNNGVIETSDLGNLQTGTLKHDGWGAAPDWQPDYVKIINDEDGRTWIARVGKDLKGQEVFRLVFTLEDAGQYEQMQKSKRLEADRLKMEQEAKEAELEAEKAEKELEDEERKAKIALEQEQKRLEVEKRRVKLEADLAKSRAEIEKIRNSASGASGGATMPSGFRTIELFGQLGGRNVPLIQVLVNQGGRFSVVAGGSVLGGENGSEGFGFGGSPGRWAEASGGQSPTAFGQDPNLGIVGFDGSRAHPVPAATLEQLFGTNWRAALS
jgi:hypothetical protein